MKIQQVQYKSNPYTSARVSAMKSLLLDDSDYEKMMKMGTNEIIKFLQDGVYKEEINALAVRYSGLTLLEYALNRHLIRIFRKLKTISDPDITELLNQYLKRYDVWNLKVLLRAKISGEDDIENLLIPVGDLKREDLDKLMKLNVEEILQEAGISAAEGIEHFRATGSLNIIENMLDYAYYKDTISFAKSLPKQGKLFLQFFRYEFDVYNIKLLLKKLYFKLDRKDIVPYLIHYGRHLKQYMVENLLAKEDISDFVNELSRTPYVVKELEGPDLLERYEIQLDKILLTKAILLFHQHPLSVDVVLGYMFAKEIEVRNIRMIVKSKALDFDEGYVKEMMI